MAALLAQPMRIRTKLILNTVSLVSINALVISAGVIGLARVRDKLNELTQTSAPSQTGTLNLQRAVEHVALTLTRASTVQSPNDLQAARAEARTALDELKAAGPIGEWEALATQVFSTMEASLQANRDVESVGKRASSQLGDSARLLQQLDSRIRSLRQLQVNPDPDAVDELKIMDSIKSTAAAVKQLLLSGSDAYPTVRRNLEMSAQVSEVNLRLLDAVARNAELSRTRLSSSYKQQDEAVRGLDRLIRTTGNTVLTVALGAVFAALFLGINLFFGIARPLAEFTTIAQRFGEGDFTVRMDQRRKNEFGLMANCFNGAVAAVYSLIDHMSGSSESLALSASKLTATAGGVHRDAASISSSIERTSLNAARTREKMKSAQALAATANAAMLELATATKVTAEAGKAAERIVRTINDIAFKTNLLSLNAAVEAARAGAAGAGFEVVAGAVRTLSTQSSEAAQSTAKLIAEVVGNTHRGAELAETTRNAFAQVIQLTNDVNELIEEIAACSKTQDSQIKKVNQGASTLQKISEQNAVAVNLLSSSVGRLRDPARRRNRKPNRR